MLGRGGGGNITPSIHHGEKRSSQNPWQFYHKTAGRLCVVETIAFLPFFCLCFSGAAAPGSLTSPQIHLSGKGGWGVGGEEQNHMTRLYFLYHF